MLPDNFFRLPLDEQWRSVQLVTAPAVALNKPRAACSMAVSDEALCVAFFLTTLGMPWVLAAGFVYTLVYGTVMLQAAFVILTTILIFHPLPTYRSSRLSLSLARWFSVELIVDRNDPLLGAIGTRKTESAAFQQEHLPACYLACPHGVFNYGAVVWCCFSRWLVGWQQYTGGAAAIANAPGLRYIAPLIWCVTTGRPRDLNPHPKQLLNHCPEFDVSWEQACRGGPARHRQRSAQTARRQRAERRDDRDGAGKAVTGTERTSLFSGGHDAEFSCSPPPSSLAHRLPTLLLRPQDGILGAFRSRPGADELLIGKKRGLMRICAEEGATVLTAWCFGTSDLLTVVQDPCGLLEYASRKLKAGFLGYYGRWGLPIPRRVATTISLSAVKANKLDSPTAEQVEELHQRVYGSLGRTYDAHKAYAGYPNRSLVVK